MQVIKPSVLGLSTRPIEYRKRYGLCITAALHVPFGQGVAGNLWGEQSMWNFLSQEMKLPLLDEGVSKLSSEFLVHGFAYSQPERRNACAVRVRLAEVEKTLFVFGDRYWNGNRISDPRDFESMPLSWSKAYGGADYPANPLGIGRASVQGVQLLPNLELPKDRLLKKDQTIEPAGLGALDVMHPQRVQHRGTYDANYLKEHSPGFPPDLDWRYFNMAPQDQWLAKPLKGDEPFALHHLHPQKPLIEGNLPGLKVKVFANYAVSPDRSKLKEVPMRLTTVWFFPHAERCILLFHGLAETTTDDGSDVTGLMGAVERLAQPKADEHYLKVMEMRADPQMGGVHSLRDSDLLPQGLSIADPEADEARKAFAMDGLQADAQFRRAQVDVGLARDQLRGMGKDPDALGVKLPVRKKVPQGDELAAYVEKQMKQAQAQQWQALDDVLTQAEKAIEFAAKNKLDLSALQHRGPPIFKAESFLQELQATGQLQGADQRVVYQKLIQKENLDRLGYLQSAHTQLPAKPMPAQEAQNLREEMLVASQKKVRYFAGMDFTGADFSSLDLRQFDFSGAWLESANFSKSNLSGANFSGAVLAHADLRGAIMVGTKLNAANLGRAQLKDAVFDTADLSAAILMGCSMDGVQLSRVQIQGAMIMETQWGQTQALGIQAAGQTFYKLDLKGVVFDDANLAGCNFIECDLSGASFKGAILNSANFVTCKLEKAVLQGAQAKGAIFAKGCDLAGALLGKADFTGCNFGASAMQGAQLVKARLDGANLSEADISGSDCRLASAKGALCRKMKAKRALLAGMNFQDAILQHADLRTADLRSSNLFGADLSRVKLDGSTLLDGALLTRARTWPRLTPEQQAAAP
jgi:uncharacterized protein YjbI with pentapeptide repeats